MQIIGLTGGIGMGKSTGSELLRKRGCLVIDTDELARELAAPGQSALAEIERVFGSEMIDPEGGLRRDLLAERVFNDAAARKELEGILHPRIRERWLATVHLWRQSGAGIGVVVIPLLFETGAAGYFDATLCAACSASTQESRLQARGWNENQIRRRNEAQWPVERKMLEADYVIWTEGGLEVHADQLNSILKSVKSLLVG